MAYEDWQRVLSEDKTINDEQRQRLLDIISSPMPEFDPTVAQKLSDASQEKGDEWLQGKPYSPQSLAPYITSESKDYAAKLSSTADNLRKANIAYNAGQMDINRALNRNQSAYSDYLAKLGMAFDTGSEIQNRNSRSLNSEINRQYQYTNIKAEYQKKINDLKRQAEEARRRGDTQAWITAIETIATLVVMLV